MPTTQATKQIAEAFLRLTTSGDLDQAYDEYVADDFLHHNPGYASDADSLREGMRESSREHPDLHYEPLRSIAEGDLVAVHGRVRMTADGPWIAVVHIFRFEDDRIVELWDIGQEPPEDMVNEAGMF